MGLLAPGTRIAKPLTDAQYDAEYGPSVLDGVPLRTSVSALQSLDPNTYGGCHRKWWYDKIAGKREPETKAQDVGKRELHEPIEAYYQTGEERFSPLVLQGRHLLYPHTERLLVEREIARPLGTSDDTPIDLTTAPLRVDGIPLVGRIDLVHALGYYLDSNGVRIDDPPHTVEVNDWKSTGKREYAKRGTQLMTDTIQMPGYGKWITLQAPMVDRVRLSHSYFCKDPKDRTAWKASVLVTREEIDRRWEYVDGLGRVMRDVACEPNVENVDGNRRSCDAYGRKGCPHKPSNGGTCSFGEFNSLSRIFGDKGASRILSDDQPALNDQPYEVPVMGLLKNINPNAPTALNLPGTPANVQAQNTPQHVGVNVTMPSAPAATAAVDMLTALAAEQAQSAPPTITPEVVAAFDVIEQAGLGCPMLADEAANARAAYTFVKMGVRAAYTPGAALAGSGRLNGLATHRTIAELLALAENLRTVLAKQAAQPAAPAAPAPSAPPPAMLPPEAPPSDPKLAALPIEAPSAPPAVMVTASAATPGATVDDLQPPQDGFAAPKKRKTSPGRPRKVKPEDASADATSSDDDQPFELYVDCVPSQPYELADQYVSLLNVKLCEMLKVTEIPDIRSAPKSCDALAFGAWKGTYEALAREAAADGHIPRARYVVFTAGNDLASAFANALIAARHKGERGAYDGAPVLDAYVRGVR